MKLNIAGMAVALGGMGIMALFGEDLPASKSDAASSEESISEVIAIKHERAAEIAAALNSRSRGLETNSLAAKRGATDALSNVWANVSSPFKVVVDEKSNSLLLYATKRDL